MVAMITAVTASDLISELTVELIFSDVMSVFIHAELLLHHAVEGFSLAQIQRLGLKDNLIAVLYLLYLNVFVSGHIFDQRNDIFVNLIQGILLIKSNCGCSYRP